MSFDEIGKGFTGQYYATMQSDRSQCAGIYRPNSLMTYNGTQLQGTDDIMQHLTGLGIDGIVYQVQDTDCHPTSTGGVLAVVNGELKLPGEDHSLTFNDVFNLALDEQGNYYVANQLSRVLGGGSH